MKKIFHLGVIAVIAIAISSCSKSSADLQAKKQTAAAQNENMQQKKISFLNSRNHHVNGADIWLDASKIYPFINQPLEMQIGNPDAILQTGQLAVFYIILSDEVAELPATSATLSLSDDATGDVIGTYNLISYKDVGTVDAFVPAELANVPFMCALVTLDDQYTGKTISMFSHIEFYNVATGASMGGAFSVTL